jgi:hypothetical protein
MCKLINRLGFVIKNCSEWYWKCSELTNRYPARLFLHFFFPQKPIRINLINRNKGILIVI